MRGARALELCSPRRFLRRGEEGLPGSLPPVATGTPGWPRSYQDGCHLLLVLRGVGRPLPQAAHVESRVVAPAASPSPVHGGQPVAPLVQRPDVGDAAQVPAELQEAARVLMHPPPPLAELARGQALRGQRGCGAALRRRPAARHQQQDSRLLEGFPDSADAEGDFPRQRRAQPLPLGGEQRSPAAADRRRPGQAQPALRRGGQQPQPVSGEIRRLHQAAREDVCAGHEAAAGAPLQQQHLIVEGAERGARQPRRRARRQQQRRRFPPVPQPPVHREGWRRRWPRPRSRSGAARAPPPPGLPEERLQPGAWAGKLGGLGRLNARPARRRGGMEACQKQPVMPQSRSAFSR